MADNTTDSEAPKATFQTRIAIFIYGLLVYIVFLATFVYFIAFVGDLFVPKSVDTGAGLAPAAALIVNLALLLAFGLQHSIMARPAFKRRWTEHVPEPIERSTYVLAAIIVLIIVMGLWQPMPAQIWSVDNRFGSWTLWALFGLGWAVVFLSTFMTDHFDLFGLRQVYLHLAGRPYTAVAFRARWLYRHMRHPLYSGFLLAFWATPDMTVGHLVLAAGFSAYIVVGTLLEERDLLATFGERYRNYCRNMPRYLPRLRPRKD